MQKVWVQLGGAAIALLTLQGTVSLVAAQETGVKTAAEELLATLDDTQKAKARQTLPGLAFGPGTQHAAGMGGPQHQH